MCYMNLYFKLAVGLAIAGLLVIVGGYAKCLSQVVPPPIKVLFLELDLYSNSAKSVLEDDKYWKNKFERAIFDQLNDSVSKGQIKHFGKLGKTEADKIIFNRKAHCEREQTRFLIDGKIEGIDAETLEAAINLYDFSTTDPPKVFHHFLPRDLKVLTYWFEKTSRDLRDIIEGKPSRSLVFTYCFYLDAPTLDDERKNDYLNRIIQMEIPMGLASRLNEKLKEQYVLKSFRSRNLMARECRKQRVEPLYESAEFQSSDFLIQGYVKPEVESENAYTITVEFEEIGKYGLSSKLVSFFRLEYNDSETFFEELAEHIKSELLSKNNRTKD